MAEGRKPPFYHTILNYVQSLHILKRHIVLFPGSHLHDSIYAIDEDLAVSDVACV